VHYLIETFIEGAFGDDDVSVDTWRMLARYAQAVHQIPITLDAPAGLFSRFGRDLDAAWTNHLAYNIEHLSTTDPLLALSVYAPWQQKAIRAQLTGLRAAELTFGLCHGDLAPRNLILPPSGPAVLVDWGSAFAGPTPYGDLVPVAKAVLTDGNPTRSEFNAFAAALGAASVTTDQILYPMVLLSALDLVRWALDNRGDRVAEIAASSRTIIQYVIGLLAG
jgi:aminoglycoside phosphotransferase (APT) family kinase protein